MADCVSYGPRGAGTSPHLIGQSSALGQDGWAGQGQPDQRPLGLMHPAPTSAFAGTSVSKPAWIARAASVKITHQEEQTSYFCVLGWPCSTDSGPRLTLPPRAYSDILSIQKQLEAFPLFFRTRARGYVGAQDGLLAARLCCCSRRTRHLSARSRGPSAREAGPAGATASSGGVCAINHTGISAIYESYKALSRSENQLICKKI